MFWTLGNISSKPPLLEISSSYSKRTFSWSSSRLSSMSLKLTFSSKIFLGRLFWLEDFSRPKSQFFCHRSSSFISFFLSNGYRPIKWNMSLISIDLTFLSNGEDEENEGKILTSSNQGLRFLSNRTSNP